jgi:hypothetical protein
MEQDHNRKYCLNLSFEEIKLPPFDDILILGRKCPHGKMGVSRSFDYLVPNEFLAFDLDDEHIETVFINKKLIRKMDEKSVMTILREKVFPYISNTEIVKVDFKVRIQYEVFEGEM